MAIEDILAWYATSAVGIALRVAVITARIVTSDDVYGRDLRGAQARPPPRLRASDRLTADVVRDTRGNNGWRSRPPPDRREARVVGGLHLDERGDLTSVVGMMPQGQAPER